MNLGFRVRGYVVREFEFRVQGFWLSVRGCWLSVWSFGFGVMRFMNLEFRVRG